MPWLFQDGEVKWAEWCQRVRDQLAQWRSESERAELSLTATDLLPATRKRLSEMQAGLKQNLDTVQSLLSDWGTFSPVSLQGDKTPATQILRSYFDNIFRDWVWGDTENSVLFKLVSELAKTPLKKTAVFGCGAGRLVYDINETLSPELLVGLDINPLLLNVAKQVTEGNSLKLTEFPINAFENAVVSHEIKGRKTKSPISWIFADGTNPPFQPKSLDTVVTPWFVDIIPQDFRDQVRTINQVLASGGQWINAGPLGFQHSDPTRRYSGAEVKEALIEGGFAVTEFKNEKIPYLQSPHSGHWRTENLLCFRAEKIKDTEAPRQSGHLPKWLQDWTQPIPQNKLWTQMGQEHQVYAEILLTIEGNISIQNLADMMVNAYGMTTHQAQEALVTFLTAQYEKSLRG